MPYRAPTLTTPPSPRGRRTALGLGVLAAVAALAVFAIRQVRVAPPTSAEPVRAVAALPWPTQAHAWTVHRESDGARQILFGPLRLHESARHAIEVAPVRFEASLVAAVPVTIGWVFVAADGTVAASAGFLDAPRPLGVFPCDFKVPRDSVGRAVVLGEDGSLWTTTGAGPLSRSPLPGAARAAAFMDSLHGAAVLRDGRVMLTADGAQHWDLHRIARDVAWNVSPERGGIAIDTTGGRQVYRWDTAATPAASEAARPQRTQVTREVEGRLRPFINSRHETFHASGTVARCAPSSVGPEPSLATEPRRYTCHADRPLPSLMLLPLAFQRNVDATDLLTGTEAGPVRGRFWRTRPDRTGETLVRMTWMGVDELGTFHGVTHPSGGGLGVHWPIEQRGPLRVEASSRRGVLVRTHDLAGAPVLAWGTSARPFVRVRDAFVEIGLSGMRSFFVPSPDGGVVAVFSSPLFEEGRETWSTRYAERGPQVGVGLTLGPDGAVRGRRGFVGDDPGLMMIGRDGASVGPVVRDNSEPPRWRLLSVEDGRTAALPSIRWEHIAACAAGRGGGPTLSAAYPPIALERAGASAAATVVSRAELEVLPDGEVCVRTLSLSGRRLTALAGDRFEGALRCEPAGAR
jgi:hypothetical protein